ncbi:hypothetical protein V8B97DRAFT_1873316, partial [Scleroderma yunnanense]
GHTNNLAHPTLFSLIIDFFYISANAMENLFPDVFGNEVSHAAIVFAVTAVLFLLFLSVFMLRHEQIKVALDEVVVEGKDVSVKQDVYMDVYVDLLELMAKCDTSSVHHTKTKMLHMQ